MEILIVGGAFILGVVVGAVWVSELNRLDS